MTIPEESGSLSKGTVRVTRLDAWTRFLAYEVMLTFLVVFKFQSCCLGVFSSLPPSVYGWGPRS